MKRIIPILCAALALCLLLGACGQTPGKPSGHVHTWAADLDNHWTDCDCDEPVAAEAHDLDEYGICADCGASITDVDEGYIFLELYDEDKEPRITVVYDADGEVLSETRYEKEYDDDGVLLCELEYNDDFLTTERFYQPCEDSDDVFEAERIYHYEDGSWFYETYDERGDILYNEHYTADGTMTGRETYEYEYDDDGNVLCSRRYYNGVIVNECWNFVGPNGDLYEEALTIYDAEGNVDTFYTNEYEFDDAGNMIYWGQNVNGVMQWEMFYEMSADGALQFIREVTYDENGEIVSETIHDDFGE